MIILPFTPFHLGPALFFAIIFFPFVDVFAVFVGSVIVDIEPVYYLFFTTMGPYHGFLHTYLGCTILSFLLALGSYPFKRFYLELLRLFGLEQEINFRKTLGSYLLGSYFHVFLDSFLYPEMKPFYPFGGNPLLYTVYYTYVYGLCVIMFLVGFMLYILRYFRYSKKIKVDK